MPGSCQHRCNHCVHETSSEASAYILTHLFFIPAVVIFLTRKSCFGQKLHYPSLLAVWSCLSPGSSVLSAVSHRSVNTELLFNVCHTHALGVVFDTIYDMTSWMQHTFITSALSVSLEAGSWGSERGDMVQGVPLGTRAGGSQAEDAARDSWYLCIPPHLHRPPCEKQTQHFRYPNSSQEQHGASSAVTPFWRRLATVFFNACYKRTK